MDFKFIFFIFMSIVVIVGAFYRYFSMRQEIAAFLAGAGLIAASVVFGLRWFTRKGDLKEVNGRWPPSINYCPDFLTLYTVGNGSAAVHYCIDTVGVAHGGSSNLVKWSGGNVADDHSNVFKLYLNDADRLNKLVAECKAKGVTWEGVFNGVEVLTTEAPPSPITP